MKPQFSQLERIVGFLVFGKLGNKIAVLFLICLLLIFRFSEFKTLIFVEATQPETNIEAVIGAVGASVILLVVGGIILYTSR